MSLSNSDSGGYLFWGLILKDSIEVQEKKKKVVVLCWRSPKTVNLGRSRSLAVGEKKFTKKCDARTRLFFCQSNPIAFFAVLVVVTVVVVA